MSRLATEASFLRGRLLRRVGRSTVGPPRPPLTVLRVSSYYKIAVIVLALAAAGLLTAAGVAYRRSGVVPWMEVGGSLLTLLVATAVWRLGRRAERDRRMARGNEKQPERDRRSADKPPRRSDRSG